MPYSRANGVDIWYEVTGDGPAMVLIHANPFDHDLWMYQAAHFSTWFKVVESRRVDSATNQVVADLRLAHTQATNHLVDASFVVPSADSSSYQVGPPGDLETQNLPRDDQGTPKTKILTAANFTITFHPDGGAEKAPPEITPGDITVMVASTDGDPSHTIKINPITSRVKVVS